MCGWKGEISSEETFSRTTWVPATPQNPPSLEGVHVCQMYHHQYYVWSCLLDGKSCKSSSSSILNLEYNHLWAAVKRKERKTKYTECILLKDQTYNESELFGLLCPPVSITQRSIIRTRVTHNRIEPKWCAFEAFNTPFINPKVPRGTRKVQKKGAYTNPLFTIFNIFQRDPPGTSYRIPY